MQIEQIMSKHSPNEQLRWERQRRGWSRTYIAEQIGVADPKTIGRWERGCAFPSAYFLQKLCALFQMPAEELGLWQRGTSQTLVSSAHLYITQHSSLQFMPEAPLHDPALPLTLGEELAGREDLFDQVKQQLCTGKRCVALSGLPGVGKTALAAKLAQDSALQQHFSDGVLWVSLGPAADVPGELRRWCTLLEIGDDDLADPKKPEEWMRVLRARIGARKMLLIIDDAWTCQEALTFQVGGPNCSYLLTTRLPVVAFSFAETGATIVAELSEREGLQLLARFVPEIVAHEPAQAHELVRLAGGLPLALQIMGKYLQMQVYSGQPRRWHAALEALKCPEARLQLSMPGSPLEQQAGLLAGGQISLQNTIEPSYHQLAPATKQALLTLARLSATTNSFSETAVLDLGISLEEVDNLLDAGLLASAGLGRYTLHQVVMDFAVCQEELACDTTETLPRVKVLRPLRGQAALHNAPDRREEVLPAHRIQRREETIRLLPARLS